MIIAMAFLLAWGLLFTALAFTETDELHAMRFFIAALLCAGALLGVGAVGILG